MRFLRPSPRFLCFFILLLGAAGAVPAYARDWSAPARELAAQIYERSGYVSSLSLRTRSPEVAVLDARAAAEATRALQQALQALGTRLVEPAQALAEVEVTFSGNVAGYLWTAEIQQGAQREVVLHAFERGEPGAPAPERPLLVVQRRPVFAHQEAILDLALLIDPAGRRLILVLHPGRVSLYGSEAGRWTLEHDIVLPNVGALPRDARGRLHVRAATAFEVYLPGLACSGTLAATVGARCQQTDDPWPLAEGAGATLHGFAHPQRNFFSAARVSTGEGSAAASSEPFFSGAIVGEGEDARTVFAALDGQVWSGPVRLGEWGSDLVAVRSECGSGSQLLVTGQGDWTAADTVRAIELRGGEVESVGAALEFAGPITTLWPAAEEEVLAVAHNLTTLRYEAFLLTVACGR